MEFALRFAAGLVAALALAMPAAAEEMPKRGGTLTYMIPEDSPPSFDAQREETYARSPQTTAGPTPSRSATG